MNKFLERLLGTIEAAFLLEDAPGPVYMIEHFQGVAFDEYEYEKQGDKFILTLIRGDDVREFEFDESVPPDILLASLQRYARDVQE